MTKHQLVHWVTTILTLGFTQCLWAQNPPSWGAESNPSPTAGSSVSNSTNAAADKSMYKDVEYTNATKMGAKLIVLPGEVKSTNATFVQKFGPVHHRRDTQPSGNTPSRSADGLAGAAY